MANEVARLAVALDASGVESGASGAASALEGLKSQFQTSSSEVKALEATMKAMQTGASSVDVEAFRSLQDQLTTAKATAAHAAQEFVNLGGSASNLMSKTSTAAGALAQETAAAKAAAASVEALAAAEQSGAKGADGLAKQLNKVSDVAEKVGDIKQKPANLEEMTALAKGALGPMGGVFEKASLITKGIGNGGMAGAAIAAAAAFVVLTSAVVSGYFALAKLAVTSNKVAMERLTKTAKTAEENFQKLFSGVHVEKFVGLVEEVAKMLDESSASAKAVKEILAVMLNPLFDAVGGAGPLIKRFFQGMVIAALLTTVAVLKVKNAFKDTFGSVDMGGIDGLKVALYTGAAVAFGLVAALVALAAIGAVVGVVLGISGAFLLAMFVVPILVCTAAVAAFAVAAVAAFAIVAAAIVVSMALVLWPFIAIGAAIYFAITRFDAIKAAVLDFGAAAVSAAGDLISGLVNGITSGAGAVYSAIKNLAGGAIATLKSMLGIASPSKVFAQLGVHTAAGFADGVDSGSGAVDASVDSMVQVPAASPSGAASKGGPSIVLGPIYINGVKDADELTGGTFARQLAAEIATALDMGAVPVGT